MDYIFSFRVRRRGKIDRRGQRGCRRRTRFHSERPDKDFITSSSEAWWRGSARFDSTVSLARFQTRRLPLLLGIGAALRARDWNVFAAKNAQNGSKRAKADEILPGLSCCSRAFLLDSGTPNIAISRSANYYERCPQYNEHPTRLSSLWNVDAQCSFPVSRCSMWRILNFTLDSEARRVNCFDQADQKSPRLRWRRHYSVRVPLPHPHASD